MKEPQGQHRLAAARGAVLGSALRGWLLAAAVTWACSGSIARAQVAVLPPDPGAQPAGQSGPPRPADDTLPYPAALAQRPPAYALPPEGWPAVDFAQPDPLLDRPYSAQPGFFTNVEMNVLWLHLHNRLSGPVLNAVTGQTDQVMLGRTRLDAAVAPRFEVGSRIPDNWGSVMFGYGFLASRGREVSATGPEDTVQAPAEKVGRLVYNLFDLTYTSREYCLDPFGNMRWGVGPRLMFFYFDARGEFPSAGPGPGSALTQSETNFIHCYGFWAFLDVEREIGSSGLRAFFRLEATDLFGRVNQNYSQTVTGNLGQGPLNTSARFTGSVGPSILREVVGVSYTVPQWNHTRFLLGYQYEEFFQIGRLSSTSGVPDTRGSLDAHGLVLRAEFNF
jgi:hypothetical protein